MMSTDEKKMIYERLSLLAQITGGKVPGTEASWKFWLEQVEGIPATYILGAINNWAKHSTRFPAVAEIRKSAQDSLSADIEKRSQRDRDNSPTVSDVIARDPVKADQFRSFMRAFRDHIGPVDDRQHLYENIVRFAQAKNDPNGEGISLAGRVRVRQAFGGRDPTDREVEEAEERYFAFSRRIRTAPKPSDFFRGGK